MVAQEKIDSIARIMRGVGVTTFIVGGIVFLLLISQFSRPSFFSSGGQLSPTEILISVLVAFYHVVLGLVCIGIAELLFVSKSYPSSYAIKIEKKEDIAKALTEGHCPQCGKKNLNNFDFCSNCGASLKT